MARLVVIECCGCKARREFDTRGGIPAGTAEGWCCISARDPSLDGRYATSETAPRVEFLCGECVAARLPPSVAEMIKQEEAESAADVLARTGLPSGVGMRAYRLGG